MTMDIDEVRHRLDGHGIVEGVEETPQGHIRIETAFLYPEGSSIALFVPSSDFLLPELKLSDLGETMSWLLDVQVRPWLSKKRQGFLDDVITVFGVQRNGGALELSIEPDELVQGVVRLGQACVRVADLVYTRRSSLQNPVIEEIEEILAEESIDYEPNVELEGRFGKGVRVDLLAQGYRTRSALLTWSSRNASQAHVQANEIFRRWYDLDVPARQEQRVTVVDDRHDVYRDDDLRRLRDVADLVYLSDRTTLLDLIAA
jgi:hypothetical protein